MDHEKTDLCKQAAKQSSANRLKLVRFFSTSQSNCFLLRIMQLAIFQICSFLKGALDLNKHAMAKSDYNVTGPVKAITAVNFRSMMERVLIRASRNLIWLLF